MPMAVNFRWKTPNFVASQNKFVQNGWAEGLSNAASAIASAKERSFNKKQQERRNLIEDEDRARRIAEEDRRKQVYGEAADMMRGKAGERAKLMQEAQNIKYQIEQLKAELGV